MSSEMAEQKIGKRGLQVGKWIRFSVPDYAETDDKKFFGEKRFFLVVSREDHAFDPCRCCILDMDGRSYDYNLRMSHLYSMTGEHPDWDIYDETSVFFVEKKGVITTLGSEKVEEVYKSARAFLEKMTNYFSKDSAETLDCADEEKRLAARQKKLSDILTGRVDEEGFPLPAALLLMSLSMTKPPNVSQQRPQPSQVRD